MAHNFKIGQLVRVKSLEELEALEGMLHDDWCLLDRKEDIRFVKQMYSTCNRIYSIIDFKDKGYSLGEGWEYRERWLELISGPAAKILYGK